MSLWDPGDFRVSPDNFARPWRPIDHVAVLLGNLAGVAAIAGAYAGASHEAGSDQQIGWLNLGVAGLIVVAAANAGWIFTGRQACWRLRLALLPAQPGAVWPLATATVTVRPGSAPVLRGTPPNPRGWPVASPAMTWYHAPTCRMVAGKEVRPASVADHEGAGRRPCGVCRPVTGEVGGS